MVESEIGLGQPSLTEQIHAGTARTFIVKDEEAAKYVEAGTLSDHPVTQVSKGKIYVETEYPIKGMVKDPLTGEYSPGVIGYLVEPRRIRKGKTGIIVYLNGEASFANFNNALANVEARDAFLGPNPTVPVEIFPTPTPIVAPEPQPAAA